MNLIKIITLLMSLSFLAACTNLKVADSALIPSLNVGVQEHYGRAQHVASVLFPAPEVELARTPHTLEYQSIVQLQGGLATGNLDVAIGLLESLEKSTSVDVQDIALQDVWLHFFYSPDNTVLANVSSSQFLAKMKSIGYISTGKQSELNSLLVHSHASAYRFEPCGSMQSCMNMLGKKQIDAFATTGFVSYVAAQNWLQKGSVDLVCASYAERSTLGLALNTLSLSDAERQQLSAIFSASQTAMDFESIKDTFELMDVAPTRVAQ